MNKREMLMQGVANVRESMGATAAPVHGAPPPGPRELPAHLRGVVRSKDVSLIEVARIIPDPDQPRDDFDAEALERLAHSLRTRGQLQPIRVRWSEEQGAYVIVCGERRWRAATMVGMASLSCVVVEGPMSGDERLAVQLIENAVREDLTPLEQAHAYRRLMEAKSWSVRELAAELAVHHAQVVRALSLLKLPESVQARVEQGTLPPATAYELSKLDDAAAVAEIAGQVVAEGLTRAEAVAVVRKRSASKGRAAKPKKLTARTLRTAAGRVTIENRKGVDAATARAALVEALAQLEAEEHNGRDKAA